MALRGSTVALANIGISYGHARPNSLDKADLDWSSTVAAELVQINRHRGSRTIVRERKCDSNIFFSFVNDGSASTTRSADAPTLSFSCPPSDQEVTFILSAKS